MFVIITKTGMERKISIMVNRIINRLRREKHYLVVFKVQHEGKQDYQINDSCVTIKGKINKDTLDKIRESLRETNNLPKNYIIVITNIQLIG